MFGIIRKIKDSYEMLNMTFLTQQEAKNKISQIYEEYRKEKEKYNAGLLEEQKKFSRKLDAFMDDLSKKLTPLDVTVSSMKGLIFKLGAIRDHIVRTEDFSNYLNGMSSTIVDSINNMKREAQKLYNLPSVDVPTYYPCDISSMFVS